MPTESPVITVSCYYANDPHKDITISSIAHLTKPLRILIVQDSDPSLLKFKREIFGLSFEQQIPINGAC